MQIQRKFSRKGGFWNAQSKQNCNKKTTNGFRIQWFRNSIHTSGRNMVKNGTSHPMFTKFPDLPRNYLKFLRQQGHAQILNKFRCILWKKRPISRSKNCSEIVWLWFEFKIFTLYRLRNPSANSPRFMQYFYQISMQSLKTVK